MTPERRRWRRALRVVCWNILLVFAGMGLIVAAGEAWFRITIPFVLSNYPRLPGGFVPGMGAHMAPRTEVRYTNLADVWQTSRTNSLGFVDREPRVPSAEAHCGIAFVGDSFVEALEVPIMDKSHVRLEAMASAKLPHLDVATAAYGRLGTGQVNQLGYYDKMIRNWEPKLVVLVFVSNDFVDNSSLSPWWHPEHPAYVVATPTDSGPALRMPDPRWRAFAPPSVLSPTSLRFELANRLSSRSFFFAVLQRERWRRRARGECGDLRHGCSLYRVPEPDYTGFALDQWKKRTERDGTSLVALSSYTMGTRGHPLFDHLQQLAASRGIAVVDQFDYILRQGADPETDARWKHDGHWSPRGHQFAAEAMLEWLEGNQSVCNS